MNKSFFAVTKLTKTILINCMWLAVLLKFGSSMSLLTDWDANSNSNSCSIQPTGKQGTFCPRDLCWKKKRKKKLLIFAMQRHWCTKILKYFSSIWFWTLFVLSVHQVSSSVGYKITPYRDLKRPSGLKRSSSLRTPRGRRDSGSNESGKKKVTSSFNWFTQ